VLWWRRVVEERSFRRPATGWPIPVLSKASRLRGVPVWAVTRIESVPGQLSLSMVLPVVFVLSTGFFYSAGQALRDVRKAKSSCRKQAPITRKPLTREVNDRKEHPFARVPTRSKRGDRKC
jgi:hypothetical protein